MPSYRVHILDQQGDLKGALAFDCPDDQTATERVRKLLESGEHGAELWRLIARLEADTSAH